MPLYGVKFAFSCWVGLGISLDFDTFDFIGAPPAIKALLRATIYSGEREKKWNQNSATTHTKKIEKT